MKLASISSKYQRKSEISESERKCGISISEKRESGETKSIGERKASAISMARKHHGVSAKPHRKRNKKSGEQLEISMHGEESRGEKK